MPHPRPSGPAAARAVTVTAGRLWQLALLRPQWLGAHLAAYASLVVEQIGPTRTAWRQRSLWTAVCAVALGVAAALAGVALMLWAENEPVSSFVSSDDDAVYVDAPPLAP